MTTDEKVEMLFGLLGTAWLVGVPVAFGVMVAKGMGGIAVMAAPIWPAFLLGYLGYWVAS